MERIAMSQKERDWLEWLKRAHEGLITQRLAAEKMGVTERWVRALVARMEKDGDRIVVHGLTGRASNRRIDGKVETAQGGGCGSEADLSSQHGGRGRTAAG